MSNSKAYPLLCTINSGTGDDGVSRVSQLLWRVLSRATDGRCQRLSLLPENETRASTTEKLRFSQRVLTQHLRGQVEWIMYDHLGPARLQGVIPRALRRPYAVFLHGVEVWSPLSEKRLRILRDASLRIANSNYTAARLNETHPGIGPIEVCHLALAPPEDSNSGLQPAGAVNEINGDESFLNRIKPQSALIVGRMSSAERYKGHDELIESWPAVLQSAPASQLVIAGEGDDRRRLQEKATRAGLGDAVIFTGHVSRRVLHELFRRVAVFAMPSTNEGFGLVYLEAMQNGLPCLALAKTAAAEIVIDGETGTLVPAVEPAQLAHALIDLLQDPMKRRALGEAGYQRWLQVFSFENFEQRLFSILERSSLLKPNANARRWVA